MWVVVIVVSRAKNNPALRAGIDNTGIERDISKSIGNASFAKIEIDRARVRVKVVVKAKQGKSKSINKSKSHTAFVGPCFVKRPSSNTV